MRLPSRRVRTSRASRSLARCCDTAVGRAPTWSARSLTECSPWSSAHRIRRRVESASSFITLAAASNSESVGRSTFVLTQTVCQLATLSSCDCADDRGRTFTHLAQKPQARDLRLHFRSVARGGGLEPPMTGPEPAVLPITPPPNGRVATLEAVTRAVPISTRRHVEAAGSLRRRPAMVSLTRSRFHVGGPWVTPDRSHVDRWSTEDHATEPEGDNVDDLIVPAEADDGTPSRFGRRTFIA